MRRNFRLTTLFLIPIIWAACVFWRLPMLLEEPDMVYVFSLWPAVLPATVCAAGLAVLVTLIRWNFLRWRAVIRPNKGRLIGALCLFLATPVAVIFWSPWILGIVVFFSLGAGIAGLAVFSGILIVGVLLWYPVAALLVSGIPNKILRFGAFCLMFWTAYCFQLLWSGVHSFNI